MPQPRYRIRLPDGQRFDATGSPAKIRRTHPSAVITHRIEHDAVGNAQLVPFTGKASEPAAVPVESEANDEEQATDFYGVLTVPSLHAEIERRGLEVPSGAKKADLVAILVAHDVPDGEERD